MKARVRLLEGLTFVADSGSGHAVVVDASPDVGGQDLGPRPMEMILMGLGTCSAIDVVHILRKARQVVSDCVVELDADRAAEDPKVFTRIGMHYQVERAVNLSRDKYCSATSMLAKTAAIEIDFEIREESQTQ